jgi:acyl-coenzyme A thioesterase PaaI-like protein
MRATGETFVDMTGASAPAAVSTATHRNASVHENCWACGASHPDGLHLSFAWNADGSVLAEFDCSERYAGYAGVLHGGMVATLLDAAMTHCLFARHEIGVTAELRIRFRSAVRVCMPATIRAWTVRTRGAMKEVCAELWQDGKLCAMGRGKFIRTRTDQEGHVYRQPRVLFSQVDLNPLSVADTNSTHS